MSTFEDCQKLLSFIAECFVEKPVTVERVRLKMLQTLATPQGLNHDDPAIKITNGEIPKVEEKEKLTEASLKGFKNIDLKNSHGEAYTLTNIYIYPIKSCGAYEV